MEGMIFAAGLGTRLRPLTNEHPKAMVELAGKPLLEHVLIKMRQAGIKKIVINVHHFAEQIETFLNNRPDLSHNVILSDERELLLDTGGGLLNAVKYFTPGEDVLIHNVDILTHINLQEVISFHQSHQNDATLVVRPSVPGRGLRFNEQGLLKGWENSLTGEEKRVDEEFDAAQSYSFCGIHIVGPNILQQMMHQGVFSIIDEYLLQARNRRLANFVYDGFFMDLGTPEAIEEAEKYVSM